MRKTLGKYSGVQRKIKPFFKYVILKLSIIKIGEISDTKMRLTDALKEYKIDFFPVRMPK